MKLKQVFTVLSVFLFCFYGILLSQGEAEDVSKAKDFGRSPVDNKKAVQAFDTGEKHHQTSITKEDPITFDIEGKNEVWKKWSLYEGHQSSVLKKDASPHLPEPFPPSVHEKRTVSEFGIDVGEIPGETSPFSNDLQEKVTDRDSYLDDKEKDVSPEASDSEEIHPSPEEVSETEAPTLVEKPFQDTPASDIVEEEAFQEDSAVHGEDHTIAADTETPPDTSPLPLSDLSPDEEVSFSEEENGDRIPVADKSEQVYIFDEVNTSFPEDEEAPVSHLIAPDEKESQGSKEKDASPHLPEPFPPSVHEKRTVSEFGIDVGEIPGETSPFSSDLQEKVTDRDSYLDDKEKDVSPEVSDSEEIHPSPEEVRETEAPTLVEKPFQDTPASDIVEEEAFQEDSAVHGEDHTIAADTETPPDTSPLPLSDLSPDEEVSFSEEENGDRIPVADKSEQVNIFDEVNTSFPEDEEAPVSHLIDPDEKESQGSKEKDASPHLPEPFPPSVHEKRTVSEFGIDAGKIPGVTSPFSNDQQEKVTDRDSYLDDNGKDVSPEASDSEEIHPAPEEVSGAETPTLVEKSFQDTAEEKIPASDFVEEEAFQEDSAVHGEDHTIAADTGTPPDTSPLPLSNLSPDEEVSFSEEKNGDRIPVADKSEQVNIFDEVNTSFPEDEEAPVSHLIDPDEEVFLIKKEEPPIDYQAISREKKAPQELVEETEEGKEESILTWEIWHSDPTHLIILAVVVALAAAKIGGWIAGTMGHPKVVGKIITGMLLGNIYLFLGSDYFVFLKTMPFLKVISYFGTLVLLLTAGLHTDLRAIFRVGVSSVLVCLGGMAVPAGLGIVVSYFLLPDITSGSKVLLSIVLCSTSTGLLFAILNELKIMNTIEGRVIVGATILTEIIVILSFGVVSGIVVKGGVSLLGISISFGIAFFFLITAVFIIHKYGERFGSFLTKRLTEGLNIPIIVILSLLMAFMFGSIGLHTVIGAFIAGLFLRNVKLRNFDDIEHRNVESFIKPFYALLVPILFVRVGALVDVKSFFNLDAVLLGIAITGAAIIGKLFCGLCPIERGTKRLVIGFGMAMKLEGTLILAGIGSDTGIFNDTLFSSVIMAIVCTSTICPFLMKRFLHRKKIIRGETILTDPKKTELVKTRVKKRMRLTIFGLSLI